VDRILEGTDLLWDRSRCVDGNKEYRQRGINVLGIWVIGIKLCSPSSLSGLSFEPL